MHFSLKSLLTAGFLCFVLGSGAEASPKILYVPLDNRPVCLEYTVDTARAAGYPLTVPPEKDLSDQKSEGNNEALWNWLEQEAPHAEAAVIATDSLNYGGLVASRKHHHLEKYLKEKIQRLEKLKKDNPGLKMYAFSTIMRTPKQSIGKVEPGYYQEYGPKIFRLSQLQDKEDQDGSLTYAENQERQTLLAQIPNSVMQDWKTRRLMNFQTNKRLIRLCQNGVFHYFALGKDDDAPLSQTHMEARHLKYVGDGITENRFQILPGVDQVGLLLVTRAINELRGEKPRVYPLFSPGAGGSTIPLYSDERAEESVHNQILASGSTETSHLEKADLVLAVNTPEDGRCLDSTANDNAPYPSRANREFANELADLEEKKPVALADISFANGADNGFMQAMTESEALLGLTAYSGWNTADNSIGFALSQGILSKRMKPADRERLLKTRLLDDWIYQANVRYRISLGINQHDFMLKYDLGKYYNRILSGTNRLLRQYVEDEPTLKGTSYTVEFPWNRMFEVDVRVK
ncbi:DUF4127 family protein [Acidaminococcus timonensis]|uniref:DUF4127 family protein n=1 Tax=Acidaminococcus timonensis TaxID=1871002 RepID=UPI003080DE89